MTKFTGYVACYSEMGENVDPARITSLSFHAIFESDEAAKAYVAARPKYLGLKVGTLTGPKDGDYRNGTVVSPMVSFYVSFQADGTTGTANERGAKRVRKFLELCEVDEQAIAEYQVGNHSTIAHLRAFIAQI